MISVDDNISSERRLRLSLSRLRKSAANLRFANATSMGIISTNNQADPNTSTQRAFNTERYFPYVRPISHLDDSNANNISSSISAPHNENIEHNQIIKPIPWNEQTTNLVQGVNNNTQHQTKINSNGYMSHADWLRGYGDDISYYPIQLNGSGGLESILCRESKQNDRQSSRDSSIHIERKGSFSDKRQQCQPSNIRSFQMKFNGYISQKYWLRKRRGDTSYHQNKSYDSEGIGKSYRLSIGIQQNYKQPTKDASGHIKWEELSSSATGKCQKAQSRTNEMSSAAISTNHETCIPNVSLGEREIRKCLNCGKYTNFICQRCRAAWLCGKQCQISAWDTHKKTCTPPIFVPRTNTNEYHDRMKYSHINYGKVDHMPYRTRILDVQRPHSR